LGACDRDYGVREADRSAERAPLPVRGAAEAGFKSGELARLLRSWVQKGKGVVRILTSTRSSCEVEGVGEAVEEGIDAGGG
jgi:hypothetical protein